MGIVRESLPRADPDREPDAADHGAGRVLHAVPARGRGGRRHRVRRSRGALRAPVRVPGEPPAPQDPAVVRPQPLARRAAPEPPVHAAGPSTGSCRATRSRTRSALPWTCRCWGSARCTRSSARPSRRPAGAQAVADHYLELLTQHQGRRDRRRAQRQAHAARASTSTRTSASDTCACSRPRPRRRARTSGSTWRTARTWTGRWTSTSDSAPRTRTRGSACRRTSAAPRRTWSGCCRWAPPSAW